MLKLDRHLSEDELLSLRDGRSLDPKLRMHLDGCPLCQKRLTFLSAFKSALKPGKQRPHAWNRLEELHEEGASYCSNVVYGGASDSVSLPCPAEDRDHPDPAAIAAYFDGALPEKERSRVQGHLLGCERCLGDLLVLYQCRELEDGEEVEAARSMLLEQGVTVAYRPGSPRVTQPQLELEMVDGPGTEVLFRLRDRPAGACGKAPGPRLEERVEVMVGTARVTVAARREERDRYLDVHARELGPEPFAGATVSLEEGGRTLSSTHTGDDGKATVAVPALPSFDLRVDGGWMVPVLLRFRN